MAQPIPPYFSRSGKKRVLTALIATLAAAAVLVGAVLFLAGSFGGHSFSGGSGASSGGTEVTPVSADYPTPEKTIPAIDAGGLTLTFRTSGRYFYTLRGDEWACTYLKGVNMGLTLPDTDLNDPDIPYDTYMAWFGDIAAMNANTVKIFTVMNPDFYRAFADYNAAHPDEPLYLLQGIWFNESYLEDPGDAWDADGTILAALRRAASETVDILHGNSDYTSYGSIENAVYDRDVSRYVVGYILGLEWQAAFVTETNTVHAGMAQYQGDYLTTQGAAPFEIFLAAAGDALIAYETGNYQTQRPLAFLNWSTTDTLTHSNEPFEEEDAAAVDTETIHPTERYLPGLFAAVDAYPYYPEFLNHQPEYQAFSDYDGEANPYRAYLRDLMGEYTVPVVIAEFGVPTSRGVAHESVMGFDQGGLTEEEQGRAAVAMAQAIAREGYAGGILFSWQDEWFKQTWNTIRCAPEDAERRGLNVESAEQRYGILAYEPGKGRSVSYPDGDFTEWTGLEPVSSANGVSVYAKSDEAYLYLLIRPAGGYSAETTRLAVPLSITGRGSGTSSAYSLTFDRAADFLLILDGKENTRLLTDAYEDRFYYQYSIQRRVFERNTAFEKRNSGLFNPVRAFVSNEIILPLTGETIPPQSYESGLLRYGNGRPDSPAYDSLADFCAGEGGVEVRLPWYLLNVMNGPEKTVLADFYAAGEISFETADAIYLGAALLDGSGTQNVAMSRYDWPEISRITYHSRLKKSYAILQAGYAELMEAYS